MALAMALCISRTNVWETAELKHPTDGAWLRVWFVT